MAKPTPSQEYLKELFEYNPDTGILTWKCRPINHFRNEHGQRCFNAKYPGKEAGCLSRAGRTDRYYKNVSLKHGNGNHFGAHRLIWALVHGDTDCAKDVEHANGIGTDNRLSNLRLATRRQNTCNNKTRRGTSLRLRGVGLHKASGLYYAKIRIEGRQTSLGYFKSKGLAAVARAKAAIRYHGEFARLA